MSAPWMLDAYCCSGGAAKGYQRAGFRVLGVDIDPQPNYCGDDFVQGDALKFIAEHGHKFTARHASPPCQASSAMTKGNRGRGWSDTHVDLIPETRFLLEASSAPFVIENVQGSSVRRDLTLCGEMFGLEVIRHRYFEVHGFAATQPVHVPHRGRVAGYRHGEWFDGPYFAVYGDGGGKGSVAQWQRAMGIDWVTDRHSLAEAIPPAYTQHIGEQLAAHLSAVAA
jgi:hypothetical protein